MELFLLSFLLTILNVSWASYGSIGEQYSMDLLLQELLDKMGEDIVNTKYSDDDTVDRISVLSRMEAEPELDLAGAEVLSKEPNLRDQEHMEHSSLWGHQYVAGGAGEGAQHLSPDGSIPNVHEVKTDANLPTYCDPPNPCPLGYTAEDGCLENVPNTAEFSRSYQSKQNCMCDPEHMFDCPAYGPTSDDSDILHLAKVIRGKDVVSAFSDLLQESELTKNPYLAGERLDRVVAKKSPRKRQDNPYLRGEKLPVVAKKAPSI